MRGETKPKILLIAEAANPEWVSVPLVGWSLARALMDVAEVHLVTQIRNREAILRAGLVEGRDFTSIDSEAIARPLWKLAEVLRMGKGKGWTIVTAINAISYLYFEHLVWKCFGKEIRHGAYDIVHRVTPLSPTINSPIATKCARAGVPFMLGPLNGGVPWPPGFGSARRREREWLSYIRNAYRLQPGRIRMLKAASAIIVGSRHTESEIPARFRERCIYIPENAIDPTRFNLTAAQPLSPPLRGCFIGRLVPYKGPDMLIEAAVPLLRDERLVLDIVGDGPLQTDLAQLVEREGVGRAVTFHGWLPHEQVQSVTVRANLLTFPSIREFGGGVVLEAMALGAVPVVVDYAGPGELVDQETGFKVPIGSRDEIVSGLRATLERISADPAALPTKAAAAQARVREHFTWHAKARQIRQIYDSILQRNDRLPEFFSPRKGAGPDD